MGAQIGFATILQTAVNIVTELLYDEDEDGDNVIEKIENFAESTVPNFNDKQFKGHFRLYPTTFEVLLQKLHEATDSLHDIHKGQPELPLEKQTLITLWCLANVESFRSVADRFGVSKSACWRILYRTGHRLVNCNRRFKIISFPAGADAERVMTEFEEISGFPRVLGAVDGCHIRIEKPREFPNSYINRKGFPSIILQGICDKRKLFTDVYVGQPGSVHDARVFQASEIYEQMQNNQVQFINDSHLIGDLAYPLSTKLLVGFKDRGDLTNAQKVFNKKLSQTRVD
jgi:hypothetical protein